MSYVERDLGLCLGTEAHVSGLVAVLYYIL